MAKIKTIKRILTGCGCVSVRSKSQDEFLAVACSPECVVEHFGELCVLDAYAETLSEDLGVNLVLVVA